MASRAAPHMNGLEVAESLAGLQELLSGIEQLASRAEAEVRDGLKPEPPVIDALQLVNGDRHPCFRLDDTQAPVLSFTTARLRGIVLEELQSLRDLDGQAEAEDEDQDSPPDVVERLESYALSHVQQAYGRLMEEYNAQRRMRPGIRHGRQ